MATAQALSEEMSEGEIEDIIEALVEKVVVVPQAVLLLEKVVEVPSLAVAVPQVQPLIEKVVEVPQVQPLEKVQPSEAIISIQKLLYGHKAVITVNGTHHWRSEDLYPLHGGFHSTLPLSDESRDETDPT